MFILLTRSSGVKENKGKVPIEIDSGAVFLYRTSQMCLGKLGFFPGIPL